MPATKHVMSFAPRKNLRYSTARCLARLWSYLEQWLAEPGFLLVFQAAHKTQDRHVQPGRHYQALCTDHPSCVIANLATKYHLQAWRNSLKFGWDEIYLYFVVEFSASLFFLLCTVQKSIKILILLSYWSPIHHSNIDWFLHTPIT